MRRFVVAALVAAVVLVGCEPPPVVAPPCQFVSAQGWWQADGGDGTTAVPQQLPSSNEGGHMHVDLCFPVNQRVDGPTLPLTVVLRSHQRLTAVGDRIDVGLAPGGKTVISVPAPDMSAGGPHCGGDPADPHVMCSATIQVDVPLGGIPSGPQRFRIRYLSAKHPSGDRQFISNELPFWNQVEPGTCVETEGKGWFVGLDYARAGVKGCLPGDTVPRSGTFTFTQSARSTSDPITAVQTYVDARFGHDEFTGLVQSFVPAPSARSLTRQATIDTTELANGRHCIAVVTQVADPQSDAVSTGVLEFPILVENPTPGAIQGRGSCFPPEAP